MTTTTTATPEEFRIEVERRLIDTFQLQLLLGLRGKAVIWKRIGEGTLPAPVFSIRGQVSLWDRDALPPNSKPPFDYGDET